MNQPMDHDKHQAIRVLVVVVNYNGSATIQKCLQAIQEQTRPADTVVIVDNASTDGSVELISKDFPEFKLLAQQSNLGFAAANNLAVKMFPDHDWIAMVNPDAWPEKNWLQSMLQGVTDWPNADMLSCRLINANDPDVLDGTGDIYHASGLSWRRDYGKPADKVRAPDEIIFSPCGAAAFYRLNRFLELDGFDETFFCYHEDVDLAFRMRLTGSSCVHLDHARVFHVGSGTSGKDSDFSVYYGHRNLVWTFVKNMPSPLLYWYLIQHLVLNCVSIVLYTLRGRPGVIFRSKWSALTGLGKVLQQRKRIQANSTVAPQQIKEAVKTGFFHPYFSRGR